MVRSLQIESWSLNFVLILMYAVLVRFIFLLVHTITVITKHLLSPCCGHGSIPRSKGKRNKGEMRCLLLGRLFSRHQKSSGIYSFYRYVRAQCWVYVPGAGLSVSEVSLEVSFLLLVTVWIVMVGWLTGSFIALTNMHKDKRLKQGRIYVSRIARRVQFIMGMILRVAAGGGGIWSHCVCNQEAESRQEMELG